MKKVNMQKNKLYSYILTINNWKCRISKVMQFTLMRKNIFLCCLLRNKYNKIYPWSQY